ncbi:Exocyst complex component 1 [Lonchura striata]|uniref:Exocyst complex component 1 n=1 Tax=Lonchura striata TaxID=40157 RepID=A0A218UCZ2_9PASE|nr:Exocyst complex component 1 [Lonchura striata domestica]
MPTPTGMQRPQEHGQEAELQEGLSAFQEVTPEEAAAVLALLEEHEPLLNHSVAFAEHLGQELQGLEEANLRAIISSEQQVAQLLSALDEALAEVGRVEETLRVCDELLEAVRQQMEHIHRDSSLLHRLASNRTRLMDEIVFLTSQLQLSQEHHTALSRADLSSPAAIRACTAAAQALSSCMDLPIHPSYRKLQAVAEQLILFETLKQNFESAFIHHITNIFELQGNSQAPALGHSVAVPSHGPHHEELLPYTPLMAWLRNTSPALFWDLPKVYSQNLGRLYEREIKALFEQAKMSLSGRRKGSESAGNLGEANRDQAAPVEFPQEQGKPGGHAGQGEHRQGECQNPWWTRTCSSVPSESQRVSRPKVFFQQVLEQVLSEIQPLCTSEQQFLQEFFWLGCDSVELQALEGSATKGGEPMAPPEDPPHTKTRSQPEEATTHLLSEIFSCLELELRAFLDVCSTLHPLGCLQVLVTLSDSVFGTWGPSSAPPLSFLDSLLGNVLLLAKSNFNKCIGTLCKEIEEARPPSRMRGGVLPCVSRFQELLASSEEMLRTSRRRGELDKAQLRLASSVFSSINSLSSANLKVNTDMVMMENFHHIHNFLCQRNIPCLESKKREAKQRSREHMEKYVTTHVGQPLERLKNFFEGVKARLAQGVKEEEVSFQLAYSKQELRKVVEKYPGKEVKRALETLYRTIHKHLSPEENLLPVVWQAMEQGFIRQYREFEDLIQRCYAGAGIALDFTMEDLLSYFNSITTSNM